MFKDREVQQNWNQKERGGDFFSFFLPTVGIWSFVCYNLLIVIPSMHVEPNLKIISFFFGKGSFCMNELLKT